MLSNRIDKLEKAHKEKERGNGLIYLVFEDPNTDKMEITEGPNHIYSGSIEAGEMMIKELDRLGDFIVRTNIPRECAQ